MFDEIGFSFGDGGGKIVLVRDYLWGGFLFGGWGVGE